MYWQVECDCCNNHFSTNTLGQTICSNCITNKDQIELSNMLLDKWKSFGKTKYNILGINFYFDRGFDDRYRHYNAIIFTTKDLSNAKYVKLDFQCMVFKFYDKDDNQIFTTSSSCYLDGEELEVLIGFVDENGYNII